MEITKDKKIKVTEVSMVEKQKFYSELITHAMARGFNKGWAAHAFRDKFKVWPSSSIQACPSRGISLSTQNWILARNIRVAKSKIRGVA